MRLDKFLSTCGLGTRSQVKDLIKEKRIIVNDKIVNKANYILDENNDIIKFDGKILKYQEFYYFLLHKPKGYLSATEDLHQPTILDFFSKYSHIDLFPVGRLDKDTTGAIIITNDGILAHQLISPSYHVDKVYIATLDKEVDPNIKEEFETGIMLDGEKTLPCKFEVIDKNVCKVTLHQGKYHQVKRMFEHFSYKVIELHREKFAFLTLDGINICQFRELDKKEVEQLKSLCKK
jgi:16S rRNA pseudouridine516 synthase